MTPEFRSVKVELWPSSLKSERELFVVGEGKLWMDETLKIQSHWKTETSKKTQKNRSSEQTTSKNAFEVSVKQNSGLKKVRVYDHYLVEGLPIQCVAHDLGL